MQKTILLILLVTLAAVASKAGWLEILSSHSIGWLNRGKSENIAKDQVIEHFVLEGFDDNGNRIWELVGDSAHIDEQQDVFIEKNVVLTLQESTKIRTDKVLWQNKKSQFVTNQSVKVHHDQVEITGSGALGRMDQKFVQINQNIRMLINAGTIITCRGPLRIHQSENRIVLYRDVWILDERGAVSSDRMDAYYDTEARQVIAVIARGNVRVSRGEDVTYSDTAIYDARTGSVKLEGAPEIDIRSESSLEKTMELIK